MTIDGFVELDMVPVKAYLLGMIYPFYTEKTAKNGKTYVLAQVKYKADKISEDDIFEHHKRVKAFLRESKLADDIQVVSNQTEEFGNLSGAMRGFSLLIEKSGTEESETTFNKIFKEVNKLKKGEPQIKKFFLKGIFDGRGSMDTNSHLIVVDYKFQFDNSDVAFNLFSELVTSLGFELVPNIRHEGEKRNPQFRIKKTSLEKFKTEIGFFSVRRERYLDEMLKELRGE